ncbi:MAG: hypothetical protein WDN25_05875 [Acetobacteraceae bacterium]
MYHEHAVAEGQRVEQLLWPVEGQDADMASDEQDVGTGTGRQTDRAATQIVPVVHLAVAGSHHDGARLVVVRPDEAYLRVALKRVPHRRDHQIDIACGHHRNARLRIDGDRHHPHADEFRDAVGDVDLEAGEAAIRIPHGEPGIKGAQADADLAGAQDADQNLGGSAALPGRRLPGLVQHLPGVDERRPVTRTATVGRRPDAGRKQQRDQEDQCTGQANHRRAPRRAARTAGFRGCRHRQIRTVQAG